MTYDTRENSSYAGQPIELYAFRRGVTTWHYTSTDVAITHMGADYAPVTISRTRIDQGAEMNRADLSLTVSRDNPVATMFIAQPPGEVVTLTVLRQHRGDSEVIVLWMGRVLSVKWTGSQAELSCEPVVTSLRRSGLRRLYQSSCPHVLYGVGCRVNQLGYQTKSTVSAINGNWISVPGCASQADGYFAGGFVYWTNAAGAVDYRMILSHTTDTLELSSPMHELTTGEQVDVYPGCNHTLSQCDTRFLNSDNYGGFPFFPGSNPFNSMVY